MNVHTIVECVQDNVKSVGHKVKSQFSSKGVKFPYASARTSARENQKSEWSARRVWNGAYIVSARGKIHQMYDSSIYYCKGLVNLYRHRSDEEKEEKIRSHYSELLSDDSLQRMHEESEDDASHHSSDDSESSDMEEYHALTKSDSKVTKSSTKRDSSRSSIMTPVEEMTVPVPSGDKSERKPEITGIVTEAIVHEAHEPSHEPSEADIADMRDSSTHVPRLQLEDEYTSDHAVYQSTKGEVDVYSAFSIASSIHDQEDDQLSARVVSLTPTDTQSPLLSPLISVSEIKRKKHAPPTPPVLSAHKVSLTPRVPIIPTRQVVDLPPPPPVADYPVTSEDEKSHV